MKKLLSLCLALALCGLLVACNESGSQGGFKVGVVDLNKLMRDSAPGKAGIKFIEAQQTKLQNELDAIQDNLEKNPTDEEAMQRLQKVYATSQQQIQAAGQNVVGALFDGIQEVLNSYREKNGYAMLIRAEALDSFDPALDVTNAVLAEVDKLKIDFKALQAEPAKDDGEAGADASRTPAAEDKTLKNADTGKEGAKADAKTEAKGEANAKNSVNAKNAGKADGEGKAKTGAKAKEDARPADKL